MRRLALGMLLLLTGCGAGSAAGPAEPAGPAGPTRSGGAAATATGSPVDLVALWTVRDAAGEEPGAILRLGDDASLWRTCGHLQGGWRVTADGLFVAHFSGGSGACSGPGSVPAWLQDAAGYRADGRDRLLVDREGRTVARLVPGGRPVVGPDVLPSLADPPVVTGELRRTLGVAAPLPAGLRPATAAELVRRWVPAAGSGARAPEAAHAALAADGTWSGSDGCNGQGGRWVAGRDGSFLAVAGAQTLIGCANVDVGGWLSRAARAGFDGAELVLLDATGREVGRLRAA